MSRQFAVLAVLLLLAGCCCRNRCPCPPPCVPVTPQPAEKATAGPQLYELTPPPMFAPPPGGYGPPCATWNNPECPNGLSRPAMLTTIRTLADAAHMANTIPPALHTSIINQINIYMSAQNCLGTTNEGPGDCCPPGTSNCNCIQMAWQFAQQLPPNWMQCNTRLQQGH